MPQEYQVAGKQRPGGLVQHRKIIVGVRGPPGLEHEHAIAEIDPRLALDHLRRWNDLDVCHQLVAQHAAKGIEIEPAARCQRAREVLVADDHRALEGGVPEDVIGMRMGIDDVPDRLRRHCADGRQQAAPFAHASAAVDHRDGVAADDKSDVGDRALVLPCHQRNGADVGIEARRDLGHGQRIGRFAWPSIRHGGQERHDRGQTCGRVPPIGRVTGIQASPG